MKEQKVDWDRISMEILKMGGKMSIAEVSEWLSKGLSKEKVNEIKKRK